MHYLFSYGTLQLENVQLESFGRKLVGELDSLSGFKIEQLKIKAENVLAVSQQEFHPIAIKSNDVSDKIKGVLFEITSAELAKVDTYEVSDYKRIKAVFDSKKEGWVYIKA